VLGLLALLGVVVYLAASGRFGNHEGPGQVTEATRPVDVIRQSEDAVANAAADVGVARPKSILFGDLHVHTTFSFDAFAFSLPSFQGEGAHPPADACDFARFCSALDFWSINDHAFNLTPEHWRETVESVRQCNAVSEQGKAPDTVAYLGWEWTNVGATPDRHFGHKNVVLRDLKDDAIPARPLASMRGTVEGPGLFGLAGMGLSGGRLADFGRYMAEAARAKTCGEGPSRELPLDCIEEAATPADLFRKLDEWGSEAMVIPHGTTWGFYTPPGSTWDKQLQGPLHSEKYQTLFEVYSGHGDSELYRDWRAVRFDDAGNPRCPAPTEDYEPSCWRAGEIIRERCLAENLNAEECEERAVEARGNAARAGTAVHRTVPGSRPEDFLDAGQCRDCNEPAFNYRPGGSAQYVLALGNFDDDPEAPRRFRMGMMASSDNHYARPGTGYKEVHRKGMTESQAPLDPESPLAPFFQGPEEEAVARSKPFRVERPGFDVFEAERQASFLLTGGLVAVHSEGRDRDAIWDAMQRKEVYGTTGPRLLLWFDLLNPPGSRGRAVAMGSEVAMSSEPIFQARAVGSFEQQPGCPAYAETSLGAERLETVCKNECYHPGDQRRPITRIEVVRIRPQTSEGEDPLQLIDDPWRSFECDQDPAGCVVTFTDPEFASRSRDTLYYVRAFEAQKPGVNADNLRCKRDAAGKCIEVELCPGPKGAEDDCLAPHEPRAWSSPIWVDFDSGSRFGEATSKGSKAATAASGSAASPGA